MGRISYPDITILPSSVKSKNRLKSLLSFKDDCQIMKLCMFLNDLAAIKDFQQAYKLQ